MTSERPKVHTASIRPTEARQAAPWAFAVVDLAAVVSLASLAIWGDLDAELAAAGILLVAGVGVGSLASAIGRR